MRQQLDTAIRLTLAAQVRNRLAWILLVVFIPVWYLLMSSMFRTPGYLSTMASTSLRMSVSHCFSVV